MTATEHAVNKVERDERGRLLPGSTPNPGGRPKKDLAFEQLVQEFLEEHDEEAGQPRSVVVLRALYHAAKAGNVPAAQELHSRGYGKARQRVEFTLDDARDIARRLARDEGLDEEFAVAEVEAIHRGETR